MLFDDWNQLQSIFLNGLLCYAGIILFLRLSGKRTLAQMNAFDFIITVALGSTLATAMMSKDTALTEGLAGLGLLVLLQFLVSWVYVRWPSFNRMVKSGPRLLYYRGEFREGALREERVGKEELLQAARSQGILSLGQVEAIVLETNGKFSIVKGGEADGYNTLQNVRRD
jgi:uncharacterized membrane protein YcaP (DUF421 family)